MGLIIVKTIVFLIKTMFNATNIFHFFVKLQLIINHGHKKIQYYANFIEYYYNKLVLRARMFSKVGLRLVGMVKNLKMFPLLYTIKNVGINIL